MSWLSKIYANGFETPAGARAATRGFQPLLRTPIRANAVADGASELPGEIRAHVAAIKQKFHVPFTFGT
jgi:hypothetical protein